MGSLREAQLPCMFSVLAMNWLQRSVVNAYRVSVTASGPSAARVAEQAVNHDVIVDNVSQKHINESRSLLTKFYFI